MADVRYVAYLTKHDGGSAKFRELFNMLPSDQKRLVRIFDYDRTKLSGQPMPSWLNGYPIMATYQTNPEVYKGAALIDMMTFWVQSMQQYSKPSRSTQQHREFVGENPVTGHNSVGSNPAEAEMNTISQSPNEPIFGRGAHVITKTLYEGKRANPGGAMGSGKITSADLDAYMAKRAACPAVRRRQAMGGRGAPPAAGGF